MFDLINKILTSRKIGTSSDFYRLSSYLVLILLIGACKNSKNKNIPDVSSIDVNLNINRFEQDLFAIDTNNVVAGVADLENKYPEFSDFYFKYVLQLKRRDDSTGIYKDHLKGFLTFPYVRELHHKVDSTYRDFSKIEKELKQGFQFYRHYFPDKKIPKLYTFLSEFTYGVVIPPKEDALAIGLDFFLGKDFEYYTLPPLNLPNYVARTQDKEHLTAKVFEGLVEDLSGEMKGNRFLDYIIHNGKKLYLLDQLLPHHADSIKLGFTDAQTHWVEENESGIWTYVLTTDLLYSDKYQDFKTLITLSPNSAGMPEEAPGRAGNWLGWQIVKAYMQRNPTTTLQQLIDLKDAQDIFNKSRYKPRK